MALANVVPRYPQPSSSIRSRRLLTGLKISVPHGGTLRGFADKSIFHIGLAMKPSFRTAIGDFLISQSHVTHWETASVICNEFVVSSIYSLLWATWLSYCASARCRHVSSIHNSVRAALRLHLGPEPEPFYSLLVQGSHGTYTFRQLSGSINLDLSRLFNHWPAQA